MRTALLALFLAAGCASNAQSTPVATPSKLPPSAGAEADTRTASAGPLRGSIARIDKISGAADKRETTVTVSLENTGSSECTVTHYKLEIALGAVATSKAPCAVANVKIAPHTKSETQCLVAGATQLGDQPGLAAGHTPVIDIVASCK